VREWLTLPYGFDACSKNSGRERWRRGGQQQQPDRIETIETTSVAKYCFHSSGRRLFAGAGGIIRGLRV